MSMELLIVVAVIAIVTFFFLKSPGSKKKPDVNFSNNIRKPVAKKYRSRNRPVDGALLSRQGEDFQEAIVDRVIDGDTVIISKAYRKIRIRLDSIDCPEDGQQWGDIAKFGLIKLIGGREIRLEEHGLDRYERTLATIYVRSGNDPEWINVNERMVTLGHAWVLRRFYKHLSKDRQVQLNRLERWARSKKVGLWKTANSVPPWKWRSEA
jgi:micrococcal nuclease